MPVLLNLSLKVGLKSGIHAKVRIKKQKKINNKNFKHKKRKANTTIASKLKIHTPKGFENLYNAKSNEELNTILIETFDKMKIKKPWQGDFNEHMSDKTKSLVFE